MGTIQDLRKACSEHRVGSIDIAKAHIWFHSADVAGGPAPMIRVFSFLGAEDREFSERDRAGGSPGGVAFSDIGACLAVWKERTPEQLTREVEELLIELSSTGGDMADLLREAAKIREVAALGARSFYMARALSQALMGRSSEDLEFWEQYKASN